MLCSVLRGVGDTLHYTVEVLIASRCGLGQKLQHLQHVNQKQNWLLRRHDVMIVK